MNSSELHLYTDSSKSGYGGTYKKQYIMGIFPKSWQELDITFLEMYPLFLLLNIFANSLTNSSIVFHSDNMAVVHVINQQTSKAKPLMKLLRPMILLMLQHNISFRAEHIPGLKNNLCDSLSRQQVTPSLLQQHGMYLNPTPVPQHLRPHNLLI